MAQLNVFELTQAELSKSLKESKKSAKKTTKKAVKESFKKCKTPKKIAYNKLRLESLKFVEDAEENDEIIDYTPEEDVVLVIDPEMEETPETEAEAEEAAEELVGDYVCKCAICGANYICDCDDITEDLEVVDDECPVCGETGEQIVIGEITPTEEVVEVEDEEEEVEDEEPAEDSDVDININIDANEDDVDVDDFDEFEEEEADEEDEVEESISRAKKRTALRRESKSRKPLARKPMARMESKKPVRKTPATRPVKESNVFDLDEVTLNRMLTKFAKENYDNVRFVKINKAKCVGKKLTLEGTVVTKKGSRRSTKFVCENFKPTNVINAKFTEIGAFTENAFSKGPSFVVDFRTRNNKITPVSLRYSYKVKEGREKFAVSGKVMNESLQRTPSRKTK